MARLLLFLCLALATAANAGDALRIVTLSPHLTELVYALGAGGELVGVSASSDYPAEAKHITRVGDANGIDVEKILSLSPDLVLAWWGGTRETDIQQLEAVGLKVVRIKGESLDDIPASILILGRLLDREKLARQQVDAFRGSMQTLAQEYEGKSAIPVFIEVSTRPLMALSNLHAFSAGLEVCGITNIFADLQTAAANVSPESVLFRKPVFVLVPDTLGMAGLADSKARYPSGQGSVKSVVEFDAARAFRQTPRMLEVVREVCDRLRSGNR